MDTLLDPGLLLDRDDVRTTEETTEVDQQEFDEWGAIDGLVIVGTTNDDDQLLLVEGPDGWTLPITAVEPGVDWVATATRGVEAQTGVLVEVDRIVSAKRIEHRLADSDETVVSYEVVLAASPYGDETVAFDAGLAPGYVTDARWFNAEPRELADGARGGVVREFLE